MRTDGSQAERPGTRRTDAYPAGWSRADAIAGCTTAAVVIPKAMAFAAIAGLPLEIGLYTALIPLVVYAAAGTSKPLSVTTTSTIAILVAGALAPAVPSGDTPQFMAAATSLTLMAGGVLLMPLPDRELRALGLANIAGSAFHNMPAGGGTSQTAVNRAAGARTQAAGIVTSAVVLATLLFLASLVALMPQAALAAVVVATTVGLLKPAEFAAIRQVRHMEFWWAVAAMAGVIFLGTLNGILAAVTLSVLVLFYQANRPPVYVLGRNRRTGLFEPLVPANPEIETVPGLLLIRTEGRVHFANAHRIGDQLWTLVHEARPRVLVFEMSAVPDLEYTALRALIEAERKLREAGTTLWLVALNPRVRDVIARSPLATILGADRIFPTVGVAVDAYSRQSLPPTAV